MSYLSNALNISSLVNELHSNLSTPFRQISELTDDFFFLPIFTACLLALTTIDKIMERIIVFHSIKCQSGKHKIRLLMSNAHQG